jgi:hypothetical protein
MRLFRASGSSAPSRQRQVASVAAIGAVSAALAISLTSWAGILAPIAIPFGCLIVFLTWWKWHSLSASARAAVLACAVTVIWFGSIDLTVVFERCDHCLTPRVVVNVRVLTCVVASVERTRDESLVSKMASELGMGCPHRFSEWPKRRYMGMVVPVDLASEGQGDWMLGDGEAHEWYGESERQQLRQLSRANPGLADEFRERVLFQHDYRYLSSLVNRIRSSDPATDTKEMEANRRRRDSSTSDKSPVCAAAN